MFKNNYRKITPIAILGLILCGLTFSNIWISRHLRNIIADEKPKEFKKELESSASKESEENLKSKNIISIYPEDDPFAPVKKERIDVFEKVENKFLDQPQKSYDPPIKLDAGIFVQ